MLPNKNGTIDYVIQVVHNRPETGSGVEILSTYYARENKDERLIQEVFAKAFITAHPSWEIKKVLVKAKTPDAS
jgi:hypothetical protein